MDLKAFYQKIRDEEAKIAEEFPVVVSLATGDGGKEGAQTEVARRLAARMIVEGLVRLATAEETRLFQLAKAEAKKAAEQLAAAARVQVAVLSNAELDRLKGIVPAKK